MNNILEYLERTAEKYPGRTAVEDDKEALTWKELEDLSRRIGTAAGKRIASGDPVVILAPKGPLTGGYVWCCLWRRILCKRGPGTSAPELKEIFRVLQPKLVLIRPEEIPLIRQAGYTGDSSYPAGRLHGATVSPGGGRRGAGSVTWKDGGRQLQRGHPLWDLYFRFHRNSQGCYSSFCSVSLRCCLCFLYCCLLTSGHCKGHISASSIANGFIVIFSFP